MKKIITGILRRGSTRAKVSIGDVAGYLYPLRFILVEADREKMGMSLHCNSNPFWSPLNKGRQDLILDVLAIKRPNIKDPAYFHILNRFENGDGYGIVKPMF